MKAARFSMLSVRKPPGRHGQEPIWLTTWPTTPGIIHRCSCGAGYIVIPKELPLPKDEPLVCAHCECALNGRWSSRNFDYEPLDPFPDTQPRKH